MVTLVRVGLGLLLVALALWVYGNRTGRYGVAPTGHGFVVVDTATGIHWVYERRTAGADAPVVYRQVDADEGLTVEQRLFPPRRK